MTINLGRNIGVFFENTPFLHRKAVKGLRNAARKCMQKIGWGFLVVGIVVLSIFVYRRISREWHKQKLLNECVILEIPDLNIKVPVMDGTDNETLSVAAGHFPDTGEVGFGNYCIAGHNSTIYAEIFNDLDEIETGMDVMLYNNDADRTCYVYTVMEYFIVEPKETWVLDDFGDNRLTIITCTDDGKQRQVVICVRV